MRYWQLRERQCDDDGGMADEDSGPSGLLSHFVERYQHDGSAAPLAPIAIPSPKVYGLPSLHTYDPSVFGC
jgi:hypothetical protein